MRRKSAIEIKLTNEERSVLERRARSNTAAHRDVVRAKLILRLADGEMSSTARSVQMDRKHVRKWAKRFERRRLLGLEDDTCSGRPPLFSPGSGDASHQNGLRAAGKREPVTVVVDLR